MQADSDAKYQPFLGGTVEKSAQTGIEETAHSQDILKEITSFIPEFTTPRQNTSTFSLHQKCITWRKRNKNHLG